MRLIDADALMAEITEENPLVHFGPFGYAACSPDSGFGEKVFMRDRVLEIVESAPTVEAVVLPYKVGDTVYFADDLFMWPAEIEGIRIRESGVYFEWVQFARSHELTEVWDNGDFDLDDIGKTVFLTREEAEAALAKMKGLEVGA